MHEVMVAPVSENSKVPGDNEEVSSFLLVLSEMVGPVCTAA